MLHVDAARALSLLTLTECIVVSPEEASRWPTTWPTTWPNGLESGAEEAQAGVLPSLVHIEQQGSRADITVATEWRVADVEVARVTTVDVSPGIVIGRAACDIRVNSDTAFDLRAAGHAGVGYRFGRDYSARHPDRTSRCREPTRGLAWGRNA